MSIIIENLWNKDLAAHKQKSHSYIFHYCISELSMIQIGCLLVGQTLNITILSLSLSRFAVALRFAFRCVCLCLSCSKWHSEFNNEEKLHKPQRRRKKTWAIRVKVNVFRLPATVWVLRSMAILKLCLFTFSVAHNDDIAVSLSLFGVFLFPWIINCVSTVPNSYIVAHRAHRAEGGKEKKRNEK